MKKTSDLLSLRSDAYKISPQFTIEQTNPAEPAPIVSLDKTHFKLVGQLEHAMADGLPSLLGCRYLDLKGPLSLAPGVVFEGDVKVRNTGKEPKRLARGLYKDTVVDLTKAVGSGALALSLVRVVPFATQKMGTSGLRKRTSDFMQPHFVECFIDACLRALPRSTVVNGTIIIGGDGRYYRCSPAAPLHAISK